VIELAFSILAADFAHLADEIATAERGGGTIVHVDVMDGHFVPNITFGPAVVAAIRPHTDRPFDVHLMIAPADPYLEAFAKAGADSIIVHVEAGPHLHRSLQTIKALGVQAGVAVNPATPDDVIKYVLDTVDIVLVMSVNPGFGAQTFLHSSIRKIRAIYELTRGYHIDIEVDGGIDASTAGAVAEAGANRLVAGNAVFKNGPHGYKAAIDGIRRAALIARGELT
jgi:ribulose-5-phosphate 3-epimerase (EC 5.1.3.1)